MYIDNVDLYEVLNVCSIFLTESSLVYIFNILIHLCILSYNADCDPS